jgi:hypothetical protein
MGAFCSVLLTPDVMDAFAVLIKEIVEEVLGQYDLPKKENEILKPKE